MSRSSPYAPRRRQRSARLDRFWGVLYAIPALAFVIVFLAYPLVRVFGYSLTSWNGIGAPIWQGFHNFGALFNDPVFLAALRNNVIFAISVPIEVFGALVIAYLTARADPGLAVLPVRPSSCPRSIRPWSSGSSPAIVLPPDGPLDDSLRAGVGLARAGEELARQRGRRDPTAIIAIVVWANFGYSVLIYLAGMSALDPQLGEAARIDGAGSW